MRPCFAPLFTPACLVQPMPFWSNTEVPEWLFKSTEALVIPAQNSFPSQNMEAYLAVLMVLSSASFPAVLPYSLIFWLCFLVLTEMPQQQAVQHISLCTVLVHQDMTTAQVTLI